VTHSRAVYPPFPENAVRYYEEAGVFVQSLSDQSLGKLVSDDLMAIVTLVEPLQSLRGLAEEAPDPPPFRAQLFWFSCAASMSTVLKRWLCIALTSTSEHLAPPYLFWREALSLFANVCCVFCVLNFVHSYLSQVQQ
jgi:hypothetical protein